MRYEYPSLASCLPVRLCILITRRMLRMAMPRRHVFRDLMTRYPADDRQERRQLIFLVAALLVLTFVLLASVFT